MKIKYVPKKHFVEDEVFQLLEKSKACNQYSNNGPVKGELEWMLKGLLKIEDDKRIVCVSSGTAALHILMFFCKVNRWAVPAFNFPTPVVGGFLNVSVFDISPETYTIPLDNTILKNCDGIIITNLFGSYVNLESWENFCKKHKKVLIFDNASSPLSTFNGRGVCNFGHFCFGSLHHTKYLGVGEGGFIVCPKKYYKNINSLNNFGFLGSHKYKKSSSNFKMSDISAAYILSHICNYNIDMHIEVQNKFINVLGDKVVFNYKEGTIYGNLPVLFRRKQSKSIFEKNNIECQKYYYPLAPLKNSKNLYDKIINFPLYNSLDDDKIIKVAKVIMDVSNEKL